MRSIRLSTIIICKNAEKTIAACLQSARAISDEIIVLDSGSSDRTLSICKQYADLVQSTDWPGFGAQKQRALNLATGEWVLSLDTDEIITPECQKAILAAIASPKFNGYKIKRLMIFAGKPIRHSGCSDAPLRLFKRNHARFSPDVVHEYVMMQEKVGTITAPMLHYSYLSIGSWIEKMNLYSELFATKKRPKKKYTVGYALAAAIVSFIKMYFLKRGFLDGTLGFVAATNAAVANYYKYLKVALDRKFTHP